MKSCFFDEHARTAGIVLSVFLAVSFVWAPGIYAQARVTTLKPPEAAAAPAVQKAPAEIPIMERTTEPDQVIAGVIREVAIDQTFIVVEDTKIITSPDFIEESLVEAGDKVKISVIKTPKGLQAVDCSYIFDEGPEDLGNNEPVAAVPFLKDEDTQTPEETPSR